MVSDLGNAFISQVQPHGLCLRARLKEYQVSLAPLVVRNKCLFSENICGWKIIVLSGRIIRCSHLRQQGARRMNKSKWRTSPYRRQHLLSHRFPSLLLDRSQLSFVHNRCRLSHHFPYQQWLSLKIVWRIRWQAFAKLQKIPELVESRSAGLEGSGATRIFNGFETLLIPGGWPNSMEWDMTSMLVDYQWKGRFELVISIRIYYSH